MIEVLCFTVVSMAWVALSLGPAWPHRDLTCKRARRGGEGAETACANCSG